jgi:uncharacterized RmlC-like cupin family protein
MPGVVGVRNLTQLRMGRSAQSQHGCPGPHHHGELESVIHVICGRARMRRGTNQEVTAETGPGGFIAAICAAPGDQRPDR